MQACIVYDWEYLSNMLTTALSVRARVDCSAVCTCSCWPQRYLYELCVDYSAVCTSSCWLQRSHCRSFCCCTVLSFWQRFSYYVIIITSTGSQSEFTCTVSNIHTAHANYVMCLCVWSGLLNSKPTHNSKQNVMFSIKRECELIGTTWLCNMVCCCFYCDFGIIIL